MRLAAFVGATVISGCLAGTSVPECHRYDAAALGPHNGFAVSVELNDRGAVDHTPERIEISMTVLPPVRGTIDLVHVRDDRQMDRWQLRPPADQRVARCWIMPNGLQGTCGSERLLTPYYPTGYYYLETNGNTVLEAGLSFYLCR